MDAWLCCARAETRTDPKSEDIMLRYRPLSKARSNDSLFISLNNTCDIRHCTLNNSSVGSVAESPVKQLLSLRARIKINS